jgi:lipopolysaccharide export system permease protein
MRILTRYIVGELSKVFLLSLAVLTPLLGLILVVNKALDQGLPPAQILQLVPYILPEALLFSVPVTLLLATTNVYSRMSGSNEVVAVKALGIFPMAILWPALILAFLLSLGTVVLNDVAVSWGRDGVRQVVRESIEEIAYGMLRTQGRFSHSMFDITVMDVVDQRLIRPTLTIKKHGSMSPGTITAREARLQFDREEGVLMVVLYDFTVVLEGGPEGNVPGRYEYLFPLRDPRDQDITSKKPSSLPLRVIPGERDRQRAEIERSEQELAAGAAFEMLSGDFAALVSPEWKTRLRVLKNERSRLHRLRTEPFRRWAAGFSCLCFAFVGAPMAIWLRHRDSLTSFFLCFAPILIVYYPAMIYMVDASKEGRFHPFTVWTANLILLIWGALLFRKVFRY